MRKADMYASLVLLVGMLMASGAEAAGDAGTSMADIQQRIRDAKNEIQLDRPADITLPEVERPKIDVADQVKIKVNKFRVTGQDIFPEEHLLGLIKENEGKLLSFSDLQKMADKLTDYFRKLGYMAARVYLPAQKINNGIVEYTVVVGKVGEIKLDNQIKMHESVIRQQMVTLKQGNYLTRRMLERAVWLLTDLAGADAKATLVQGKAPGTLDIVFTIKASKQKTGYLYADNYGSRYSGYAEAGVAYDFTNLAHHGDHFAMNILRTNRGQYSGSARYTIPVLTDGLLFNFGYSQVGYEHGAEYRDYGAIGLARVYSTGLDYAIRRSAKNNLYVGMSYEHVDTRDELRVLPRTLDHNINGVTLSLYGNEQDQHGATVWRTDYKLGNLGGEENLMGRHYDIDNSGKFTKLKGNIVRREDFNNRLSLFMTARAQYSGSNLDSYERMSLGGPTGVKAYPTGEASGDSGYLTRAEMRWYIPVKAKDQSVHLASYLEHGGVWRNDNISDRRRLQDLGLGIIWQRTDDWYLRADYAWKLGAEDVQSDVNNYNGRFWIQGGVFF